MDFQQSKTKENLARSFASECMEGARYQFLAKMAQQQGFEYMSNLVRTLAHNEMAHAQQFFNKINEYGGQDTQNIEITAGYPFKKGADLCETLKLEAHNEEMSAESIYPSFADIARDEGFKDVAELFDMVAKVEKTHQRTLEKLAEGFKCNCLYKCNCGEACFKCDECGTIVEAKQAPKTCPLCNMEQGYYRIDFSLIGNGKNRTKPNQ